MAWPCRPEPGRLRRSVSEVRKGFKMGWRHALKMQMSHFKLWNTSQQGDLWAVRVGPCPAGRRKVMAIESMKQSEGLALVLAFKGVNCKGFEPIVARTSRCSVPASSYACSPGMLWHERCAGGGPKMTRSAVPMAETACYAQEISNNGLDMDESIEEYIRRAWPLFP